VKKIFLVYFAVSILFYPSKGLASTFGGGGTDPSVKLSLQNVSESTTSLRNDLNASTTTITLRADSNAVSTTSLKNEINALHIATASITARADQTAVSTTTQNQRLNNLDTSTGTITGRVNQIAIDTATTQMQVNALHLATSTIFAGGVTTYLNISGSTQTKNSGLNFIGNVGIGTTSPSSKFDVINGSITVRGGNAGLRIANPTNPAQSFQIFGGTIALNDQMIRLRGLNDANHGIGMFGLFRLWNGTDNVNGPVLFGNDGGRLGTHDMFTNTTTTELAWTSAGRVGIGTTVPSSKFDVVNGSITVRGTNAGLEVNGPVKVNSIQVDSGTILSRIQAGTAFVGGNGVSGVKTITIIFPSPFSTAPKIMVTPRGENYADVFAVTTRNISTINFQINVQRVDGSLSTWGQNLQVDWFAWE
jgi:hypothetical protein